MRKELLNHWCSMVPYVRQLMGGETAIAIWDRTGTPLFFDKESSLGIPIKEDITITDKNNPIIRAMESGKSVHTVVPREIFGVSMESNVVPIFDEGEVVGCITCAYSVENSAKLREEAASMHHLLTDSKDTISDVLTTTKRYSEHLSEMQSFIANLENDVKEILHFIQLIKKTSNSTKILALNASIEAARAKEAGLGFNIVAKEMGRLSEHSTKCVSDIETSITSMKTSMTDVSKTLETLTSASNFQPEVIETLLSQLDKVN